MFETTLMASNPRREARHRLVALPAALAVHALALGVVAVGQLWAVDPVHDVVLVPPLVVHLPPPLGGGHTADRPASRGSTARQGRPERIVQPPAIPAEAARVGSPEAPSEAVEVTGTEGLTDEEATDLGIGDGPVEPGVDYGEPAEPPRRIGGDIRAPVAIARPAPRYPEVARKMRIEGVVLVEAIIDQAGNVVDARALNDIGMGCKQAALDAVRSWRYEPATLNGRPVSVYLEVRVSFQLRGAE